MQTFKNPAWSECIIINVIKRARVPVFFWVYSYIFKIYFVSAGNITHSPRCISVLPILILQKKIISLSFIQLCLLGILQLQSNFQSKNVCFSCNYGRICAIISECTHSSAASNESIMTWSAGSHTTSQRSIQITISLD